MMRAVLFFMSFLFVIPAQAQVTDTKALCQLLAQHRTADSAVYKAGVDVDGNAVVPADLNSTPPLGGVLDVVKIPLEVDLAERFSGFSGFEGSGLELEAPLGMLEIHQDGTVKHNGQDWTQPILALCGESHKEVTVDLIDKIKHPTPNVPTIPDAPEFKKLEVIDNGEGKALPNNLAITNVDELEMPAVSAPIVEAVVLPEVSQPPEPIKPLIGTPKKQQQAEQTDKEETATEVFSNIIRGQDHR